MDANAVHVSSYRRALQTRQRSDLTIRSYLDTIAQLAAHHDGADVAELERADIEDYLIAVSNQPARRRSYHGPDHVSATTGVKFRNLRAFYNWLVDEDVIPVSPMARMKEPKSTDSPVPIVPDDDLRKLLKACAGKDFEARRDTAIIRIFCEPGSPRVAEMCGILLDDLDMRRDKVRLRGKGNKVRDIPFGPKTGQAIDRYLLVRRKHRQAALPELWLGYGGTPLRSSGVAQMLRRRCDQAGISHIHPHQLRHTAANDWKAEGGSDDEAMDLFGWTSPAMPALYGRSARTARAQKTARRKTRADRL